MELKILWIAPVAEQWEQYHACTPPLADVEWLAAHSWPEVLEHLTAQPAALICGRTCPSGSALVPEVDAYQMLSFLTKQAPGRRFFITSEETVAPPGELCEAVGAGEWHQLCSRLSMLLLESEPANPLQDWNEILLMDDSQMAYRFQCPRPELRSDLLSFLEVKRTELEGLLGLGGARSCRLGGADVHCEARFLEPGRQLWMAHHRPGLSFPEMAGWDQLQALKELGVRP